MNNQYNIWNKWDPLKTVMLGDCYGADFFHDIKNPRIKSALTRIADETQEDLSHYEKVLKDFGCNVLRPELDPRDSILNYMNNDGQISNGVPRSPLHPRDCQMVIGNSLFYTGQDHFTIQECLNNYKSEYKQINAPLNEFMFQNYKGDNAPDWPDYTQYLESFVTDKNYSASQDVNIEIESIHSQESKNKFFPVDAPSITVVGKDIYFDQLVDHNNDLRVNYLQFYIEQFNKLFPNFRCNVLNVGGHNDGSFHTLKPGTILSLREIQRYQNTFPGWDVCYLPDQSWSKVEGFLKIKKTVEGKWWVPDQEDNDEFTHFVETWLQDWVGFVEETVFDVNVLVLDEHHVCVSNMNPTVNNFLKKHNMEPVHVPWRHRYFWDGGLHCLTLDLYREGVQQDYFPNRRNAIQDIGFD